MKTTNKLIVSSSFLHKALNEVKPAINKNTVLPIFESVLCSVKDNVLTVSGTDLENSISVQFNCEANGDFMFCMPHKSALKFLSIIAEQPITITVDERDETENEIRITTDDTTSKVIGFTANNFPRIPTMEAKVSITLDKDMIEAISKARTFVSDDKLRPIMTGIAFNFEGVKLKIYSTDAHRLYRSIHKLDAEKREGKFTAPLIFTKQLLKEGKLQFNDTHCYYDCELAKGSMRKMIISRLIEGNPINYDAVIPTSKGKISDFTGTATLSYADVLKGFKTAIHFANETTKQTFITLNGLMTLKTVNLDWDNEVETKIIADYKGEQITLALNAQFVLDILSQMDSEYTVTLNVQTPNKAMTWTQSNKPNELFLQMPIMITP